MASVRLLAGVLALVGISAGLVVYGRIQSASPPPSPTRFESLSDAAVAEKGPADPGFSFRIPSGEPPALSCDDARALVRQAREHLAYPPPRMDPQALATATADWIDPHGLWSACPDSPVAAVLERQAVALVRELETAGGGGCSAARAAGDALTTWTGSLRVRFDAARKHARDDGVDASFGTGGPAADPVLEAEVAGRSGTAFAEALGVRVGAFERSLGPAALPYADSAERRFFPALDGEGWSRVVLAGAVRAYVPLLDPHGAWAPADEEASVYDIDLEAHPPDRLWEKASRTALGVLVESDPLDPLHVGDVVVAIAGVSTAGLPLEQLDQLAFAVTDTPSSAPLVILREGEHALRTVILPAPPESEATEGSSFLPATRVSYGASDAIVVEIHDVRSDLADALVATLQRVVSEDVRPVVGLLLDLRGNGGGSTEGAIASLGLFLPDAPLFPMARRDGAIEVDRAPTPNPHDRWTHSVATLVDGDTASAAEMIAGALAAYHRGSVVGTPTYGKGCAQEYLDDDATAGILRLTTLLYALPDGSPVQGVGLTPTLLLSREPRAGATLREREADVANAPPTWRGPDVRDPTLVAQPGAGEAATWPEATGAIGPCRDLRVCEALRALGSPRKRPATARSR